MLAGKDAAPDVPARRGARCLQVTGGWAVIVTLPAGTGRIIGDAVLYATIGAVAWVVVCAFWVWFVDGGSVVDLVPLSCWGFVSVLAWLLGTGRMSVMEAAR